MTERNIKTERHKDIETERQTDRKTERKKEIMKHEVIIVRKNICLYLIEQKKFKIQNDKNALVMKTSQ